VNANQKRRRYHEDASTVEHRSGVLKRSTWIRHVFQHLLGKDDVERFLEWLSAPVVGREAHRTISAEPKRLPFLAADLQCVEGAEIE
jgi:hypothetical protein